LIEDELDQEIVRLIQKNGKLTYEEISGQVDRPPSTVRDRIKRMEENGTILGYSILIDEEKVGVRADAFIRADVPLDRLADAFASLMTMDCVSEVMRVSGDRRIMFRIRAKSNRELIGFIDKEIRPLGFQNIEIMMVMDHLIRFPGL